MFGGLEMKGSGGAKKEGAKVPAAPAAPSSGFGFLNSSPAPEPTAAPTAPSSGFGFLNSAPAESAPAAAAPPATDATSSGFSFLQEATAPAAAAVSAEPAKTDDPTVAAAGSNVDAPLSGFSFMGSPSTSEPPSKPEEPVAAVAAPVMEATSDAVSSGFSFLSSSPDPPLAELPEPTTATPAPAMDLVSAAMPSPAALPAETTTTTMSATTSFAPAGAGISFGGASTNTSRPKKKKSRAIRVGMGAPAATTAASPPPPPFSGGTPAPTGVAVVEQPPPTMAGSPDNTRDDARDAAQRAEDFMERKLHEQSLAEREAEAAQIKAVDEAAQQQQQHQMATAPAASAKTGGAYDDDMMAAAAAAAKEAQAMSQKGVGSASRGIMGGLFRRASPSTSSNNLKASAAQSRPPQPTIANTSDTNNVTKPSSANSLGSHDGKAAPAPAPQANPISSYQPAAVTPVALSSTKSFSSPPPLPPRPAYKAEPPKPRTPQEMLKGMLLTFRQDVETSMAKVTQLRQQRSRLVDERQRALAQDRLATQQRDLTEEQLTTAAESEDFELADQLGSVLETYQKEQEECSRMLKHIDMAVHELDNQKQTVVDGVLRCFQSIKTQLETFESTEESKKHKSGDTAMKKFASMTKHLASEHERLQSDLKHLERDEGLMAEERKEVESAISEQSGQFESDRDDAKEKLVAVETEVEELRKQLKAKEMEVIQLRNDVAGSDDSILQVRVQFSRQLQRVQKKETTIQDHRNEWDSEKAKFSTEKESHEKEVAAHSEALQEHEKLMSSLKEEISLATVLEKIVQSEIGEEHSSSGDGGDNKESDGELLGLQAEVVKCEAAVAEASEVCKMVTTTLVNLEQEMGTLIAKIPQLEAVKKEAAAKRDFKAAGKASKEIKDATTRVKDCQEELTGEAVERKETAEKLLKKLEEELSAKRKISSEKEKETGLATMKKLADRIQHVVETKKQVCGEEYESDRVQGVGAFVLEEQIKSLVAEGKACGKKYGGWEELVAGILSLSSASESAGKVGADGPKEAKNDAPPKPKKSKKELFASYRQITQEVTDIEPRMIAAAEEEEYELADELSEALEKLVAELEAFDLTDEEAVLALAGAEGDDDSGEEPIEETPAEGVAAEETAPVTDDGDEEANNGAQPSEEDAPASEVEEDDTVNNTPSTDENDPTDGADPAASGFGFLANQPSEDTVEDTPPSDEDELVDEDTPPASGFGFLANQPSEDTIEDTPPVDEDDPVDEGTPPESGFGFLTNPSSEDTVDSNPSAEKNEVADSPESGFGFLANPASDDVAENASADEPATDSAEGEEAAVTETHSTEEPPVVDDEKFSEIVTPSPSGEGSVEPATGVGNDEDVDENKSVLVDDGFVAVDDDDL